MEQSDAERHLVRLLRGQAVAEFCLQVSAREKHSNPVGEPRLASAGEFDVDRDHGNPASGRANHDARRELRMLRKITATFQLVVLV
jgi:hypothetical protein